jgi:hypothetical protein
MALDTTIGGTTADSWADVAFADAHFAGNPHAEMWSSAEVAAKEWALRTAATIMNTGLEWNGAAASSVQALAWPRTGLSSVAGATISGSIIPLEIKRAQCELALQLLEENRLADNDAARQGLTNLKVGPISMAWKGTKPEEDFWTKRAVSDAVLALLPRGWYHTEDDDVPFLFQVR